MVMLTDGKFWSDDEILANRRKVVDYLKNPELRKAKGQLRNSVGGRCCLGHMCDAMGLDGKKNASGEWFYDNEKYNLPDSLVAALGMNDSAGRFYDNTKEENSYINYFRYENGCFDSLANLNDDSTIQPDAIGHFLEGIIYGDSHVSPWTRIEKK
jgi:hypothetical protein